MAGFLSALWALLVIYGVLVGAPEWRTMFAIGMSGFFWGIDMLLSQEK